MSEKYLCSTGILKIIIITYLSIFHIGYVLSLNSLMPNGKHFLLNYKTLNEYDVTER